MKLTFLGADHEVTGSCHYLCVGDKNILIDCGMEQGNDVYENQELPIPASDVDYVLLTHAHIDHSGLIPLLYVNGFRGSIYCTEATVQLCDIMLRDSAHIQMFEAEWRNRKAKRSNGTLKEFIPLYDAKAVYEVMKQFVGVKYDEIINIDDNISVRFKDVGHLLGSASIEVWAKEKNKEAEVSKKIVFSGDIGNINKPITKDPAMVDTADYVVMESTYGNRSHNGTPDYVKELVSVFKRTFDRGGNVVIPSFAVGRTQEILFEINKLKDKRDDEEFRKKYEELMRVPVYVDSPLAISATEVFEENMDLFDEETKAYIQKGNNPLEFPGLKFTRTVEESKALNESDESCIIISASGMCDVGRIKHHLKHNIWNPKNTILFVGYQAPGTLGYSIVNGAKKIKLFGEEVAVNARIEYIEGYSGHADQEGLLNFIYSFLKKPKHIFLLHGEPEGQEVLKNKILETTNLPVSIPSFGETYELTDTDVRLIGRYRRPEKEYNKFTKLAIIDRLNALKEKINDMEDIVNDELTDQDIQEGRLDSLSEKIKDLQRQINRIVNK